MGTVFQAVQFGHAGRFQEALEVLGTAEYASALQEVHGDVVRAALLIGVGRGEEGGRLAWDGLPLLGGDRRGHVVALLVVATQALLSGDLSLAGWACARAESLVNGGMVREWRVAVLCLWALVAQQAGSPEEAQGRAERALRLSKNELDRVLAHLTLAQVMRFRSPYLSVEQARLALGLTNLAPVQALAESEEALAYQALSQSSGNRLALAAPERIPVRVQLLDGAALWVGERRIPLENTPRLALLLSYLCQYDGALLIELAEQLLPEQAGGRVRHQDEYHRMTRVRQDASRIRQLLADPSAVQCRDSRLFLGRRYEWHSDLLEQVRLGNVDESRLPPGLKCDWLESLLFSLRSTHP